MPSRLLILSSSSPTWTKSFTALMPKPAIAAAKPMARPLAAVCTALNAVVANPLNFPTLRLRLRQAISSAPQCCP